MAKGGRVGYLRQQLVRIGVPKCGHIPFVPCYIRTSVQSDFHKLLPHDTAVYGSEVRRRAACRRGCNECGFFRFFFSMLYEKKKEGRQPAETGGGDAGAIKCGLKRTSNVGGIVFTFSALR